MKKELNPFITAVYKDSNFDQQQIIDSYMAMKESLTAAPAAASATS